MKTIPNPAPPRNRSQIASNPFRSERLRPGTIGYIFDGGQTTGDLLEHLRRNKWRGEIVGPHGTGKSTLIHDLLPRLKSHGFDVSLGSYAGGKECWSQHLTDDKFAGRLVVIDGFEQLSAWKRWKWKLQTRLQGHGLIVTAHKSVGLPTIRRTRVDRRDVIPIARKIAGDQLGYLTEEDVLYAFDHHNGNMRDTLFDLYDLFESRRGAEA